MVPRATSNKRAMTIPIATLVSELMPEDRFSLVGPVVGTGWVELVQVCSVVEVLLSRVNIDDVKVVVCGGLAKLEIGDSVKRALLEVEKEVEVKLKLIVEVERILGKE